jgi:hypothetical protein
VAGAAGRRLGNRFVLEEVLGRGGMGTVWQAWDTLLDRPVAVKEITLPAAAVDQPELKHKVLREARLAARLSHQGAVTVYDAVESEGQIFIIMELVRAETLHDLVKIDGPLPPARVAELGMRVLDVLVQAHEIGIVHRDVKPGNIMVGAHGSVKLADFGIARLDGTDSTITASGVLIGSPAYMAPEHIRHRAAPSSDVWALGATMFFAVEGFAPYQRETAGASLAAVLAEDPPTPVRAGPELGPLLLRILARDVKDRPSVTEIRQQLGAIAQGAGVTDETEPNRTDEQLADVEEIPSPVPIKLPAGLRLARRTRRDGWLTLSATLCLVAFLWWALAVVLYRNAQLPGAFTTAVVEKHALDNGLSVFAVLWTGEGPTAFSGIHAARASAIVAPFMLIVVTMPGIALLLAGLAMLSRKRQLRVAALLVGGVVLWFPGFYGYGMAMLDAPRGDNTALFGVLAMACAALAAAVATVRLIRGSATWLCRRPAHWGLAVAVVATASLWLITDLGSGPRTIGDTAVEVVTSLGVSILAGLLAPHAIGARVLAGWLFVIALRVAVDIVVLVDFREYSFTNSTLGYLPEAPRELVLSVALTMATALAAAVLIMVLSGRSHDRAEDLFHRTV